MEEFVKGDVVILPFPFSDLTDSKKRPALVVSNLKGEDIILCQITSEARIEKHSIILTSADFKIGGLYQTSLIRTNRLFTADKLIILYKAGSLKEAKIKEVEKAIIDIFKN